jgi:hypothetical protein
VPQFCLGILDFADRNLTDHNGRADHVGRRFSPPGLEAWLVLLSGRKDFARPLDGS